MKNTTKSIILSSVLLAGIASCSKSGTPANTTSATFKNTFPNVDTAILIGNYGFVVSGQIAHDRVQFGVSEDGTLSLLYNPDQYTTLPHTYKLTIITSANNVASGSLTDPSNDSINGSATLGIYQSISGRSYYKFTLSGAVGHFESAYYIDSI